MARTVVLIILLDTVPEFPKILNQTLTNKFNKAEPNANYIIHQCDPTLVNSVLNKSRNEVTESNDLERTANEEQEFVTGGDNNELTLDDYTPELNNFYFFKNAGHFINAYEARRYMNENKKSINEVENPQDKAAKVVVEETAPYLIAIFETLSNVTAQTCGGTLLSSKWVITAASCVNVLGSLYSNKTNSTEKSIYTVVAGSTNPLVDGSVHNVTKIVFPDPFGEAQNVDHAKDLNGPGIHVKSRQNSSLVMLKINPGLTGAGVALYQHGIIEGLGVFVYGWTLFKNKSVEAMRATSSQATVTSASTCHFVSASRPCLILNHRSENKTQMGSGGPVMVRSQGSTYLLGVLLDDRAPMLAEPLDASAARIHRVLSNTTL